MNFRGLVPRQMHHRRVNIIDDDGNFIEDEEPDYLFVVKNSKRSNSAEYMRKQLDERLNLKFVEF